MKKWKAGPGHFEPDMKFFGSFFVQLPNTHSTEGDNSTFFFAKMVKCRGGGAERPILFH